MVEFFADSVPSGKGGGFVQRVLLLIRLTRLADLASELVGIAILETLVTTLLFAQPTIDEAAPDVRWRRSGVELCETFALLIERRPYAFVMSLPNVRPHGA